MKKDFHVIINYLTVIINYRLLYTEILYFNAQK